MPQCFFIMGILEKVPQCWRGGREHPGSHACPQHFSRCWRLATRIVYIMLRRMCVCVCVCVCVCARAHVRTLVPMALIMTSFLSLLEKRKNTYFESSKETFETHHLINKWVNRGQRNRVTRLRSHSWLEPGQEHKAGLQSSSWRVCASLKYRWTPTNTSLCTWVQGIWSKWA